MRVSMSVLRSLFGDTSSRIVRDYQQRVEAINVLEEKYAAMSRAEIGEAMRALRAHSDMTSEYLDEILPDVFAMVREASLRTLKKRHFDVQLIGGMILHAGAIAEMRTGEGKTLAATLPAVLNAILGRGVHIITVNDYLARRDTVWMGEIYDFLGFSVGCIGHDMSYRYVSRIQEGEQKDTLRDELGGFRVLSEFLQPCSRKEAYGADITYGTNNEFGFDWLRDNLAISKDEIRQKEHYFAIVDEVDSILIDEARTPLIISAPDEEAEDLYKVFAGIAPKLHRESDYTVDEKMRVVLVTDEGISKVETMLGVGDLYSERGIRYVRHLEQALKAHVLFHKDRHYVVKGNEIIIVDEFTGRMMPGRRWSEGLHQAIEAKEGVQIQKESRTLATITFQNYFRMYDKLSGMTGTAQTSAEEFHKVYRRDVVTVPTHRPMVRKDHSDKIYQTEHGKYLAVARDVKERHVRGQPVLLGTPSIEKNEKLSLYLTREGVPHNVLNAKNHEREAEITAQAGRLGAVTIATNIAGRGVDIILGGNPSEPEEAKKVCALGGLCVIATERHEARRIDNQLRGRAGRQGDPGESQFFLSLEDDLFRIFASDKIKNLMGRLGIPEDEPIEARIVSKALEQAQAKIEGLHFDARKHLLDYDDVMSKQRTAVYRMRREMLFADQGTIAEKVKNMIRTFAKKIAPIDNSEEAEREVRNILRAILNKSDTDLILSESTDLPEATGDILLCEYDLRSAEDPEGFTRNAQVMFLQVIDMMWKDHLEVMEYTRSSVGLRAYGQRDPLVEYKNEAYQLFQTFNDNLISLFVENIFKVSTRAAIQMREQKMVTNEGRTVADRIIKNADGDKIGRNDPCPCGAKKPDGNSIKYKHCHGKNA